MSPCGDCKHLQVIYHAPFAPEVVELKLTWRFPFVRREVKAQDKVRMDWCHRYPKAVLAKHRCGEYEPLEANF